jgi:hypothetical protein
LKYRQNSPLGQGWNAADAGAAERESSAVPPSSAATATATTTRRERVMTWIMLVLLSLVSAVSTKDGKTAEIFHRECS